MPTPRNRYSLRRRTRVAGSLGIAAGILAGGLLAAEEPLLRDLSVRIESLPTAYGFVIRDDGGVERSGDDRFQRAFGVVAGLRSAPTEGSWGPVYGWELAGGRSVADGVEFAEAEARGSLGLAWRPHPACLVLVEGLLGVGWGRFHVDALGPTLTGPVFSSGVQAVLRWRIVGDWSLLGAAGWRTLEGTFRGDGDELEIRQSGRCYALGMAWAW